MNNRFIAMTLGLAMPLWAGAADSPKLIEQFEKEIRPLFVEHCQSCHNAEKTKGGFNLTSRSFLVKGGESGPAINLSHFEKSLLLEVVKYDGDLKMLPKGKLKANEIKSLETWIKSSAAWPEVSIPEIKSATISGITAEQKAFWSFQPIGTFNSQLTIDTLIDFKLKAKGLQRSKPADKRIWLRRVTFDLTGLPPSQDEWNHFEFDQSSKAFETVVERLLASPQYGERWGRHWLDVARYADTNGMDENTAFQNAWRYRDYVVRSFNSDKPFDQFVREQIAGDLLHHADDFERREHLIATGFLVLGPKLLAEPDKQKMVMDIVDEQLDTAAKAFLGLTVGCARCHDHKFDPIPTKDYYAIAGIFASTKTMQSLSTVAKANERPISDDEDSKKDQELQKRIDIVDKVAQIVRNQNTGRGFLALGGGAAHHAVSTSLNKRVSDMKRFAPPMPMALSVADEAKLQDVNIHIRGNHTTLGDKTPRGALRVIDLKMAPVAGSGRFQLANWISSPQNPLTTRVIVNRIWQLHFGEGIVRSPDNFGRLGERPSHPELLDWLAGSLISDKWSIKSLHRKIVLSFTYRQANGVDPIDDPENRLLSHFPRRRLDAESIRDSMLAISGQLDRTLGGSLFQGGNFEYARDHTYDSQRRSIYLPLIRNNIFDFFQTFDFPEPNVTNGQRAVTTVAPQSLFLLNNPFVTKQSFVIAEQVVKSSTDPKLRAEQIIRKIYLRSSNDADQRRIELLVTRYRAADSHGTQEDREKRAWAACVKVLFASNEFLFVE